MCIATAYLWPCLHKYGYKITTPCSWARPLGVNVPKTECLTRKYTFAPNNATFPHGPLPQVCPDCFRKREESLFAEAKKRIMFQEERKNALETAEYVLLGKGLDEKGFIMPFVPATPGSNQAQVEAVDESDAVGTFPQRRWTRMVMVKLSSGHAWAAVVGWGDEEKERERVERATRELSFTTGRPFQASNWQVDELIEECDRQVENVRFLRGQMVSAWRAKNGVWGDG